MKKIFFTLLMCVASFAASAQTLSWNEIASILVSQVEVNAPEIEEEMAAIGAYMNVSGNYDVAQKTVEYIFDFEDPLIVQYVDNTMLKQTADDFVKTFIESFLEEDPNIEDLKEVVNTIKENNGKIKIIFTANGLSAKDSKTTTITADDFKKMGKSAFGYNL